MEKDGDITFPKGQKPFCFDGSCPVFFDRLLPEDVRVLKIRNLMIGLHDYNISERICREYEVTMYELNLLVVIDELMKELKPAKEPADG